MIKRTLFGAAIAAASLSALASSAWAATRSLGLDHGAHRERDVGNHRLASTVPSWRRCSRRRGELPARRRHQPGQDLEGDGDGTQRPVCRDDDSGGSNRPLVRINGTPDMGGTRSRSTLERRFGIAGLHGDPAAPRPEWCWLLAGNRADGRGHGVGGRRNPPPRWPRQRPATRAVEAGLDDPAGRTPRLTAGRPPRQGAAHQLLRQLAGKCPLARLWPIPVSRASA